MKRFLTTALVLITVGATAHATTEVSTLLEKIADRALNESLVCDGDASVVTYHTSKLSDGFARARLAKSTDDKGPDAGPHECGFEYKKGADAWDLLLDGQFPAAEDVEFMSMLTELKNSNEVAEIYVAEWDGASGDSEYCLMHYFDIYTKSGNVLELHINETD